MDLNKLKKASLIILLVLKINPYLYAEKKEEELASFIRTGDLPHSYRHLKIGFDQIDNRLLGASYEMFLPNSTYLGLSYTDSALGKIAYLQTGFTVFVSSTEQVTSTAGLFYFKEKGKQKILPCYGIKCVSLVTPFMRMGMDCMTFLDRRQLFIETAFPITVALHADPHMPFEIEMRPYVFFLDKKYHWPKLFTGVQYSIGVRF